MPSVDAFFEDCNALNSGKSPLQILREARELLSVEARWTQQAKARDACGRPVRVESPSAVMWCVEGAVARVCNPFGILPPSMMRLLDKVVRIVFFTEEEVSAGVYNDLMHYKAVINLLDEAILIEELKWNGTAN